MRSPIHGANEATEMELGIKKITQLCQKSTLNLIGKIVLEQGTLHNHLYQTAAALNTKTIKYWTKELESMRHRALQDIWTVTGR